MNINEGWPRYKRGVVEERVREKMKYANYIMAQNSIKRCSENVV